jgi:hypothetical protein
MDASRNFTISEGRYHKAPCYLCYKVEQQGAGQREGCALGFKTFFSREESTGVGNQVSCLLDRCSTMWAILLALFPLGYFWVGLTLYLTTLLLISAFWVARVTCASHWNLAKTFEPLGTCWNGKIWALCDGKRQMSDNSGPLHWGGGSV